MNTIQTIRTIEVLTALLALYLAGIVITMIIATRAVASTSFLRWIAGLELHGAIKSILPTILSIISTILVILWPIVAIYDARR